MIVLEEVHASPGGRPVLRGVSLAVAPGEKVALTGPSGSGKSSVLRVLAGLLPWERGRVVLDGAALVPAALPRVRRHLAVLEQDAVPGAETGREALLLPWRFALRKHEAPPKEMELQKVCARLGLAPTVLDAACAKLSGGERMRLVAARCLLLQAPVVLADEVTAALDAENRDLLIEALLGERERTVLSVAHDPSWCAACDRVVRIVDGQEVDDGTA